MACVLAFYGCLNMVIAGTGVCVYLLIDPVVPTGGVLRLEKNNTHGDGLSLPPSLAIRDLAFNMVPDNLVTASCSFTI